MAPEKIIYLPGGQINDPLSGKHYSLPFLPATSTSLSQTHEGLFELTTAPFKEPRLLRCVWGYRESRTLSGVQR